MKNLKKVLAVALVVVMIAITMVPAFAADSFSYGTQATTLNTLGLFEGTTTGTFTPDLGGTVTREQGIIIILKLLGKKADAEAMSDADAAAALAKYTDMADISSWATKYVAYAVKNGLVSGMSDTTMAPQLQMQGKMFATILLKNLGYNTDGKYDTACAVLQEKGGLTAAQATLFNDKPLIRDDVVGIAFGSLQAQYATGNTTIIGTLISTGVVDVYKATSAYVYTAPTAAPTATPAVAAELTVTVTGASKMLVALPVVPADTTKVVATVKRGGVAVTVTPTFNADNTQMTLTSSTKLLSGDYSINVKNDTTDLGTKTVTVAAEKIGSIQIISDVLVRESDSVGYAKYKVLNQYNEDITSSAVASISATSSLQTAGSTPYVNKTNGTIKVSKERSNANVLDALKDYKTVTLTAYDSTTGVTITKTLDISSKVGDLASLTLKGVVAADGGDATIYSGTSRVFYIDYEAKDSKGNLVTDYNILYNSIDPDGAGPTNPGILLPVTSNIATAAVVQDPKDSNKAKIQLTIGNTATSYGVTTITAICPDSGITANINIEVKKAADTLDSLTLQLPSTEVAKGDKIEIPFTASDITGAQLTSYDKLNNKLTLSPNDSFTLERGANGTAKLYFDTSKNTVSTGNQSISATVSDTGKMSLISINVRDAAVPSKITAISTADFVDTVPGTVVGALDAAKVTVTDIYDRKVDMKEDTNKYTVSGTDYYYYVYASTTSNVITLSQAAANAVTDGSAANDAIIVGTNGANKIKYTATANLGTATISFKLYKSTDTTFDPTGDVYVEGSEKTITVTNHDWKDVSDYKLNAIANLYAPKAEVSKANLRGASVLASEYTSVVGTTLTPVSQLNDNSADVKVYGYTSGGVKIQLPDANIVGFSTSDPTKFIVSTPNTAGAMYAAKVWAATLGQTETSAAGKVTATVKDTNGIIHTASLDITSSNAMPVAASIGINRTDAALNSSRVFVQKGDVYYVTAANLAAQAGKDITKYHYNADLVELGVGNVAAIYFEVLDQYGKKGLIPESISITKTATVSTTAEYDMALTNGKISFSGTEAQAAVGDMWTITAVSNGIATSIVIKVVAP